MTRIMKFFRVIKKRNIKKHFLLSFNNVFYLFLLTSLLLLLVFQNCSSNPSQDPNLFSEQTASNDKGYIIAYLPSEDENIAIEDHFLIDTDVKLKVMNSHSDSEDFKWKITRAFETITDGEETTTESEYQHKFEQYGSYDVFATSYKNSDLLTVASKRLVIGEECSLTDVLEIFLESGSLTVGQTATFGLKNATDFSNIIWKVTLPSSTQEINEDDSESIELDFTNESTGSVTIEVSAEDPNNSDCLTYRKQVLQVSSNSKPHFNPITIKHNDEEIAVMLESNNIYKYLRPEGGTWTLHTNIQNANQCEFQIDSGSEDVLNCSDGVIDITSSESCVKSTIAIQASTSSSITTTSTTIDSQTSVDDIAEQFYYNYCPSEGSYCYFSGPLPGPLSYQTCDNSILSQSVTRNPSSIINGECNNSVKNGCSQGTLNDIGDSETHYQWQCLGTNNGNDATDCSMAIDTATAIINGVCDDTVQNGCTAGTPDDGAIADTSTHYRWQCVGSNGGATASCTKAIPVNGVCNNSRRNSCSSGIGNDSAIADTNTHYRWHCVGANGGSTATNCQKAKSAPVNGVCNNSQQNGCSSGTANDSAIADTNTHYRWHCVGANGGTTAQNCQKAKPINGACDNNQQNSCSAGTANDNAIADTNTHYRWHCVGANGGTTAQNCQKAKSINGACDNNQQNGCSSGRANDAIIADTNTHYRWHCVGANGGTTAQNCQKAKPINGVCNNSQRNSCSSGTANDGAIADTNTHYRWYCVGANGGTTAQNCQKARPINGACDNNQQNGCSAGTANDKAIADTNTHYRWYCVGANGGTTAQNCQKAKPTPVNGVCNNSQRNSCSSGTANDGAIADTNTHYTWHCEGSNGGTTAQNCQKARPVNGVCDNSQQNGCSAGTANDNAIADTNTHYRWHCVGANGGTTAQNCQKAKSINGACDNNQQNGCSAGTANDNAIADTNTHYRWHCVGSNGGTTAQNCQKAKPAPVNGVCNNSQRNGCSAGTANDNAIADTNTHYTWHCEGSNGGTTAIDCQKLMPIHGVCDNSQQNGCSSGTANDGVIADTNTHYRWYCIGANGGTTAIDCQKLIPIDGVCDQNQRNGCSAGTAKASPDNTHSTLYLWVCEGLHGGKNQDCTRLKSIIEGVCDNSQRNGCSSGTPDDGAIDDTDTHYTWLCMGAKGGATATDCQIQKTPINGSCNLSQRNGCHSGTPNPQPDDEVNSGSYRWFCEGLHGGTTATCLKRK